MKNLLLMRHAKAESALVFNKDKSRNLSAIGLQEARYMGALLNRKHPVDAIIASPAYRTIQTANELLSLLGFKGLEVKVEESLYECSMQHLLSIIRSISKSHDYALIVGHNPIMTESVEVLTTSKLDYLPTAGLLHFEFPVERWEQIEPHSGKLINLDYPSKIIK